MSTPVPYRSVRLPAPRHVAGDAGTAAARDLAPAAPSAGPVYLNPVLDVDGVDHGDPFVLEYCGEYVLYHGGPHGVRAYRSRDLVAWEPVGVVLAPQGSGWAQVGFRAPEVVREGNGFVMYVAATVPGGTSSRSGQAAGGDDALRRQGVARAQSPTGPFVLDPEPLLPDEQAVDAHPFTAGDGSRWLFSTARTDQTRFADGAPGTGTVVRRLDADGRPVGDAEPVCSPTERWEGDDAGDRYRNEGAVVLERGGWFHQLYSGGFGGPGSAVGVTRAPVVRGPWRKDPRNPVFVSGRRITGPGRPMVVTGPDGATPYAVYHGYDGAGDGRTVCLDRLRWAGDAPRMGDGTTLPGRPGEGPLPVPPGPLVDPDVPHRSVRAWVEGGTATLHGVDVALPARPALLTAGTDGATAVVRLDGVVVARVDVADLPPRATVQDLVVRGGTVLHAVTTSRLDDEHHVVLDAGTSRSWRWGGRLAVTVEVAVRGRATLRLGAVERHVDTVDLNGGTGFAVVVLSSPVGADRFTVTAGTDTEVADVVLASRPVGPVRQGAPEAISL